MGFLDDLSKTISKGGSAVAEKAKEISELTSATTTMEKEKVALEKLYNELGKKMYEGFKDEAFEKFPELAQKIDNSLTKIAEAKANIDEKKGNRTCPSCGKALAKGSSFCPACGRKVVKATSAFCPSCGKEVSKGSTFCPACGAGLPKVEQQKEESPES